MTTARSLDFEILERHTQVCFTRVVLRIDRLDMMGNCHFLGFP